MKLSRRVASLSPAICLLPGLAFTQGLTSQISGSFQDPSSSAIPGVEVVLRNTTLNRLIETKADESGRFVFAELLPGRYDLHASSTKFKRIERTGIELSANERLALGTIRMEVGSENETVFVTASQPLLETETADRSGLVDSSQVRELALKGRDLLGLVKILPGTFDANSATRDAAVGPTSQGLYFNGTRNQAVNVALDGITTNATGGSGPFVEPSVDAVSEVKVLLGSYTAEYGRNIAGSINLVTKSGTPEFRGGAYYFFRNEALNANEFFYNRQGLARPLYRSNLPGYFLGGPVLIPGKSFNKGRDKLYFFWSQEFLSYSFPTSLSFLTVPTALERQGDFSHTVDVTGKLIAIKDPTTNAAFPGNVIPPSRLSQPGITLLKLLPQSNTSDPNHTYNYQVQSTIHEPKDDRIFRVDWNVSTRNQLFGRIIFDDEALQGGYGFTLASNSWSQLPINRSIDGKGYSGTFIHTFSATKVNELTVGMWGGSQSAYAFSSQALAMNTRSSVNLNLSQFFPSANPYNIIPNATFGGITNAAQLNVDARYPYVDHNLVINYLDNYSQIIRSHALKAGIFVENAANSAPKSLSTRFNGAFAFDRDANNPLDTGYAFSNAALGVVDSYSESSGRPITHARDFRVEWYAQDTWKATPRLTFNLGVRFYWIPPTVTPGTAVAAFDPALYDRSQQPPLIQPYLNPATGARVGRDPVTGQLLPAITIGTFSSASVAPYQGTRVFNGSILNGSPVLTAPRLGLAWDVFGTGKTAIRTGAGVFYDRFNDNNVSQLNAVPPLIVTPTTYYTTINDLFSSSQIQSPSAVFGIQRNWKVPALYTWSFGIQQYLGFKTVLDVSYVGNAVNHLLQTRDLNATAYGTNFLPSSNDPTTNRALPVNFLRPYPGYASIQYLETSSNSNYHSLQVQLNRRLSSDLSFGLAYTWSQALDVSDTDASAVNPVLSIRSRNYGPASFDHRHNLTVNFVYLLPRVSKLWNTGFSRQAFDGWELSGIGSFITGPPTAINYTFLTATDVTGASGVGIDSRVDLTCNPNLPRAATSLSRALDTSCVHAPTKAELGIGNAPKYPFTGPGINNIDLSLFKNFRVGSNDNRRLQFRLESFNAFNHPQFTIVDNNARFDSNGNQVSATFATYTGAGPARHVSLGLKFYF